MLEIQYILLIALAILIVSIGLCYGIISVYKSDKRDYTPSTNEHRHLIPIPEGVIVTSFENPIMNNTSQTEDHALYVEDDPYPIPSDIHNL